MEMISFYNRDTRQTGIDGSLYCVLCTGEGGPSVLREIGWNARTAQTTNHSPRETGTTVLASFLPRLPLHVDIYTAIGFFSRTRGNAGVNCSRSTQRVRSCGETVYTAPFWRIHQHQAACARARGRGTQTWPLSLQFFRRGKTCGTRPAWLFDLVR